MLYDACEFTGTFNEDGKYDGNLYDKRDDDELTLDDDAWRLARDQ